MSLSHIIYSWKEIYTEFYFILWTLYPGIYISIHFLLWSQIVLCIVIQYCICDNHIERIYTLDLDRLQNYYRKNNVPFCVAITFFNKNYHFLKKTIDLAINLSSSFAQCFSFLSCF